MSIWWSLVILFVGIALIGLMADFSNFMENNDNEPM